MKHYIEIDGVVVPMELSRMDAAKTRDDLLELKCYAKSIVRVLRVPDFATVKRTSEPARWVLVGRTEN